MSDDLIINLNQTALQFYRISQYSTVKKGEKSIPITNSTDKRQITETLAISLSGNFLPMQLIFQGKTDRCHLDYTFPKEFHITHTENHWSSSEEKSKEFVLKILKPYLENKRRATTEKKSRVAFAS